MYVLVLYCNYMLRPIVAWLRAEDVWADLGTDQTIPITLVMRPQVSQGRSRSQPVLNYEVTSVRSFNRRTTAVTVSSALQRTWVSVIIPSLSSFRRRLLQVQSL